MRPAQDSNPNPSHCIDGSGYCILMTLIWYVLYLFLFKPYHFCSCSSMTLSIVIYCSLTAIFSTIITIQETYENKVSTLLRTTSYLLCSKLLFTHLIIY